jgi:uncharacterized protein (TIGR03437 family)
MANWCNSFVGRSVSTLEEDSRLCFSQKLRRGGPDTVKGMKIWMAAILMAAIAPQAVAQYNISTLFLNGAPIPGSGNAWSVNAGQIPSLPLSIEGNYVAFVQCGNGCGPNYSTDGIWVENLSTQTFTHLVAPSAAAPGTSGASFATFGGYALVAGGRVFFLSLDPVANGLYSVPVTGGAVTLVANLDSTLPGLGHPGSFTLGNSFQFLPHSDGTHIAFFAKDQTGQEYSYIANIDGTGIVELGGPNIQIMLPGSCQVPVNQFLQPRVFGSNVALMGSTNNGIGPFLYRTGLTGFPTAPTCSPGGFVIDSPILQYNTPLPGEPASVQFFYAAYLTLDSSHVYFTAQGGSPVGSYGVYRENLDGSGLTAILNSTKPALGLNPPYVMSGGATGFAAESGTLVFSISGLAADGSAAGALLAYQNGTLTRIAGAGDVLAGAKGIFWAPPIGPNSINGGRVVFSFGNPEQIGFFLAAPASASPSISSGGVVPLFGASSTIQPGSWISIYGTNLITGSTPVSWNGDFPISLGGTSVTINNKAAYLSYVSPTQINLQAPDDTARGTVNVAVMNANGSAMSTVTLGDESPTFSLLGDGKHVAAIIVRSDGSGAYGGGTYDIVGPAGSSLGYPTVPAKAGDAVVLFGVGFGPTNPAVPAGKPFSSAAPAASAIHLTINGTTVTPAFVGLSGPGLFQFNLTIPSGIGTGDQPLLAMVGAASTQSGVVLALQ